MGRCVNEVVHFLGSLYYDYIHWPTTREQLEDKALRFFQKFGKPCTVGSIDGTHIAILRPDPAIEFSYLNRKAFHSMNILVRAGFIFNYKWLYTWCRNCVLQFVCNFFCYFHWITLFPYIFVLGCEWCWSQYHVGRGQISWQRAWFFCVIGMCYRGFWKCWAYGRILVARRFSVST